MTPLVSSKPNGEPLRWQLTRTGTGDWFIYTGENLRAPSLPWEAVEVMPVSEHEQSVGAFGERWGRALQENAHLREALELIAAGKRPDGTYNRSREACEQLAREALEEHR